MNSATTSRNELKAFSFTTTQPELPLIVAVGAGAVFAYHQEKTAASMVLLPTEGVGVGGACVCARSPAPFGQGKGSFVYGALPSLAAKGRVPWCALAGTEPRRGYNAVYASGCLKGLKASKPAHVLQQLASLALFFLTMSAIASGIITPGATFKVHACQRR
jgi:hypothetical protein